MTDNGQQNSIPEDEYNAACLALLIKPTAQTVKEGKRAGGTLFALTKPIHKGFGRSKGNTFDLDIVILDKNWMDRGLSGAALHVAKTKKTREVVTVGIAADCDVEATVTHTDTGEKERLKTRTVLFAAGDLDGRNVQMMAKVDSSNELSFVDLSDPDAMCGHHDAVSKQVGTVDGSKYFEASDYLDELFKSFWDVYLSSQPFKHVKFAGVSDKGGVLYVYDR